MTRRPSRALATATALAACLVLAVPCPAGGRRTRAPEPPPRPATEEAAALLSALDPASRGWVEDEERVVTLEERETPTAEGVRIDALSVGVLSHPPEIALGVLRSVASYPEWLVLNPTYKEVRVHGADRMTVEIGKSDSPRAQRTLTYDVAAGASSVTWTVTASSSPVKPGSTITYEVAPHPTRPQVSVVVHRQVVLLPDEGRLTRYLTSDDDEGRNRYWKDANKHSRRTHWAVDAAIRHPAGRERRQLYLEHYQREFSGSLPYWAK